MPTRNLIVRATLAVLLLTACKSEKSPDRPTAGSSMIVGELSQFAMETVDYVAEGLKRSDVPTEVHFKTYQAEPSQLNHALKKRLFTFEPTVEGVAMWTGRKTLAFKPADSFESGMEYRVTVHLDELFPAQKDAGKLTYVLKIAPRDVVSFSANFETATPDSDEVVLRGQLVLSDKLPLKQVKGAVELREAEGDVMPIRNWEEAAGGYKFEVTGFERGDTTRRFVVRFDGKSVGVVKTAEVNVDLHGAGDFTVVSSGFEGTGDDATYKINFDSELASQQKISEFLSISPAVDIKASYVGRRITIGGKFALGTEYTVTLKAGVKSRWNKSLTADYVRAFTASDLPPVLEFSQKGVFLTSEGDGKIAFRTTNISAVHVEVKEVFANNLGQFLQSHSLYAGTKDRTHFNVHPVGKTRFSKTINVESKKNQPSQSTIDISAALGDRQGVYVLSMRYSRNDLPFKCKKNRAGVAAEQADDKDVWYWNGADNYNTSPCGHGFWYSNGWISRPVVVSDIGMTTKIASDGIWVFVTDTTKGAPLAGATVRAFSYQQQEQGSAVTDAQGLARLPPPTDGVFYVEAIKGNQRSAMKPADSQLNLSTFNVGGVSPQGGLRTFTYTERGVFRPGDPIHLTTILRNRKNSFPTDHPVEVRLFDPKGKEKGRETRKTGTDGVYAFTLHTDVDDRTGNWGVRVFVAGKQVAYHSLKIETIVPPRLKLKLIPHKAVLRPEDKEPVLKIESKYLFGAPAANLRTEVGATITHHRRSFPQKHPGYIFDASSMYLEPIQNTLYTGTLDDDGVASTSWVLPSLSHAPSDLRINYDVKVFEKGGRYVREQTSVPIRPWNHYVGVKSPDGQARVGKRASLQVVVVDDEGTPVAGRKVKVRIYTNRHRWWWQGHGSGYHQRYKSDKETRVLMETEVTSANQAVKVEFSPKEYGELLFEVEDVTGGHTASALMWTYGWRRPDGSDKSATLLSVETDAPRYLAGETAHVSFTAPGPSRALTTIERGGFILDHFWTVLPTKDAKIDIPIKREYGPNAYAFVHVVQPHGKVTNDKPVRTYGVVSLNVDDPLRKLKMTVEAPEEIRPRSKFSITVKNDDTRDAQFTIAVVDEGLLDITHFKTPNAESFFYAKQSIGVQTSDMYDQVIGAIWGDITKRFAIGGGGGDEERKQVNPVKAKRFEPVSLFRGPLAIKAGGAVQVPFEMPNYNGSVRVMVIATHKNAYASVEETVPVRAPIVLLPTLPRVAGPGDIFDMPVSVFGLKDDVGKVALKLTVEGPAKILGGEDERDVTFEKIGEKEIIFRLQGLEAMGVAKIKLVAKSKKYSAMYSTELAVRPASTITSDHVDKSMKANKSVTLEIPKKGLEGGQSAEIILSTLPDLGFGFRAANLVRYPYGCLEQTTSTAFPQLYLRELFPTIYRHDEVDRNINAALSKLQGFQGHDGGFYYWRYWDYHRRSYADWATSYVGHFMVEAKKKGYYVAESMMTKWLGYQRSHATVSATVTNLYRLYTLALSGNAQVSVMNRIREDYEGKLSGSQLMLLAGAYEAAGMRSVAIALVDKHETAQPAFDNLSRHYYDYYWRYSYGSPLRDTAIELQIFQQLGMENKAFTTYKQIAQKLSARGWHSTQTLAWSLLAIGQFVERFDLSNGRIKVEVEFPNGKTQTVDSGANAVTIDVSEFIGKSVKLTSKAESTLFSSVAYDYLPLRPEQTAINDNMALDVTYHDEDGREIDPTELNQGKTFWAVYRITSTSEVQIEDVALTQILPAGWEIENTRLSGEAPPSWLRDGYYLGGESYMDLRDDRIMWFFDLRNRGHRYNGKHNGMAFAVKLNTIGVGEFDLAPTFAEAMYDANYRSRIPGKRVKVMRP